MSELPDPKRFKSLARLSASRQSSLYTGGMSKDEPEEKIRIAYWFKKREKFWTEQDEALWSNISKLQVTSPIGMPTRCTNCRRLDLAQLFHNQIQSKDILGLGKFEIPILFDKSCPLCCLVESITPPSWRDQEIVIQSVPVFKRTGLPRPHASFSRHNDCVFLAAGLKKATHFAGMPIRKGSVNQRLNMEYYRRDLLACGFLAPVAPPNEQSPAERVYGRAIRKDRIDFDLVRSWINKCSEFHNHSKGVHERFLPEALIDCEDMMVVKGATVNEYVALCNPPEYSRPWAPDYVSGSRFPEGIPNLIEDAITVAKKLGYRYLFASEYCRPSREWESSSEWKKWVFFHASLVIVAAGGPDAVQGLHGVSDLPRVEQPRANIGGMTLVSTMSRFENLLWLSNWSSVNWNLHDEVCTRRRLYFTEQQVHFQCDGMFCSETIDMTTLEMGETCLPPAIQSHPELSLGCKFSRDLTPEDTETQFDKRTYEMFVKTPRWQIRPPDELGGWW